MGEENHSERSLKFWRNMSNSCLSRRTFLAAAMLLAGTRHTRARSFPVPSQVGFRLGVASYSLRNFNRSQAIEMIRSLGTVYVNIKSFHLPYETSRQERQAARREFEEAGLSIVGGGTITMKNDDEAEIRSYFKYAQETGMPLLVIAPAPLVLPRIEKCVQEYGISVAIHNHGPEDEHFPAPADALRAIQGMDRRVGLCIDVGHTARAGADVLESIRQAGHRLLDMHVKDLHSFADARSQCIVGQGKMPVAQIFRQLQKMNYRGCVNLEYEIDPDNPLPGMQQSFAYMRGVLAGLMH